MKRIATLLAIAVLAAGCTTTVYVTAPPATKAPVTAEPTVAATPVAASPKPKATPKATPKPTAIPATGDWQAFLKHEAASSGTMSTDMSKLTADLNASKADSVILADADRVIADAHAEIAWLKANPPSPCYKQVYSDIYNGTVATNNAMVALEEYDVDAFTAAMDEANTLIGSATDGIDAADTACGG
jgi:hypothetical protein